MVDLPTKIRNRLKELGKSARRASIDGGLTPDAIRNVLREKSHNPRRDTLEGIAAGLDWTLEEFLELSTGDDGNRHAGRVNDVPLISWVTAGGMTETVDPYSTGDGKKLVPVIFKRGTLIALEVRGSSMNRIAPPDSVIIVDYTDRTLVSGKYYLVKHDGEATFKRYRSNPERLEPDSTDPHETIFVKAGMEIVGRVVQVITDLS